MPITTSVSFSYETLSAMITPALFMTANGSLIISTSNRMSRIVDRIRALNEQADGLDRGGSGLDYPNLRRAQAERELGHLVFRSNCIRAALTTLYLAMSAFVGTSLALAVDVLLDNRFRVLPTALAVVGVILMLSACIQLSREGHRALKTNRQEVEFHRDLRDRRHTDRGETPPAPPVSL